MWEFYNPKIRVKILQAVFDVQHTLAKFKIKNHGTYL